MSGLYYAPGSPDAPPGYEAPPGGVTQTVGFQGSGPTTADVFGLQQQVQRGIAGLAPPPSPKRPPAPQEPVGAFYSPSSRRFFAGGRAFDERDVQSALAAATQFEAGGDARPPSDAPDWQPITRGAFEGYISGLSQRRGSGELVSMGAQRAVGGAIAGVGYGAQMLGASRVGPAIASFGEGIQPDEFEQQRDALIRRSSGLGANIVDAVIGGIPDLALGIAGGIAGAAVGGPVGAVAGATLARGRTIGAVVGAAATGFPQYVASNYQSARDARTPDGQPAFNTDDPAIQAQIFGTAAAQSLIDALFPAYVARSLSPFLLGRVDDIARQAGQAALTRQSVLGAAGRGAAVGVVGDGIAEGLNSLIDQAVFDPEFRRLLSVNDRNALLPYMLEKYTEGVLIGAGAGALLSGGVGAGTGGFTAIQQNRVVDAVQALRAQREQQAQQEQAPEQAPEQTPEQAPLPPGQGELFPDTDLGQAPQAPLPPGQGELFPGTDLGEAPLAPGEQGDLFAPTAPEATVTPEAPTAPEATVTPEAPLAPEAAPVATPEAAPVATPEAAPVATPEAAPVAPPEAAPVAPLRPTAGWKLHLNVDADPALANEIATWLTQRGIPHKVGRSADQAGKGMTIYVGARDRAVVLARELESSFTLPPNNIPDEQSWSQGVAARFDADGDGDFHQYGVGGIPILRDDLLNNFYTDDRGFNEASRVRADAELRRRYGAFYAGETAPTPAAKLKRGRTRATETGQVPGDRLRQRQPTTEGGAAPRTGRGDSSLRRGAQQTKPAEAPVARADEGRATPRVVEDTPDAQVTRALEAPGNEAQKLARLQGLRESLETRIAVDSARGRPVGQFTKALERLESEVAKASKAAEGVAPPQSGLSRWATAMNDSGEGYSQGLSEAGRRAWDDHVAAGGRVDEPTARKFLEDFKSESVQEQLRKIEFARKKFEEDGFASEKARDAAMDLLGTLADSPNPVVRAAAKAAQNPTSTLDVMERKITRRSFVRIAGATIITAVTPSRGRALHAITDAQLLSLLRAGDINGALQHLAQNATTSWGRKLASDMSRTGVGQFRLVVIPRDPRQVASLLASRTITAEDVRVSRRAYGWVPLRRLDNPTVFVVDTGDSTKTGLSEEVVLHEIFHAWVLSRIHSISIAALPSNARTAGYTIEPNVQQLLTRLRTEWSSVEAYARRNRDSIKDYSVFADAFSNPDEYAAYALTSSEFREFLGTIKYNRQTRRFEEASRDDPQSMLARFFRWLSELLFGNPLNNTALARFTDISDSLFRTDMPPDFAIAESINSILGRPRSDAASNPGRFSLADWNTTGNLRNADGTTPQPMTVGRAKLIVQNVVSRLATKPKVTVVANQADLRRTNRELYNRAKAARPDDFDSANAAGYAFGNNEVIIFTDRIANNQHLRFVLAHEAIGHHGLRGIMPKSNFDAVMNAVYDTDPAAQAAADIIMDQRKLSKSEAVEEYLADYAAVLDTSTVARVWNAIRRFLNALGVKSGDAATRYLLDQARRYARTGVPGSLFDNAAVAQRMHDVEHAIGSAGTGRFSPGAAMSEGARVRLFMDTIGAAPTNIQDALNDIANRGKDLLNTWDDIKAKYLSLSNYNALQNPGAFRFNNLMQLTNNIAMSVKSNIDEFLRPVLDASATRRDRISQVMYAGRDYALNNFDKKLLRGANLVAVDSDGNFVVNKAEEQRLFKAGLLTLAQIRSGFSYDMTTDGVGKDGKPETIKRSFAGFPDFTQADYDLYLRARQAMANVEMELLRAEYANLAANRKITHREVGTIMKSGKLDPADRGFIDAALRRYNTLYTTNSDTSATGVRVLDPAAMKRADDFVVAVNQAFIGKGTDRNAALVDFFDDKPAADAFIDKLMAAKGRRKDTLTDSQKFELQNQIKQLYLNTFNTETRERITRRGIATGYTPVVREGKYQMRLQAMVNGKPVEVKDSHQALLAYSQFADESAAKTMAGQFNSELEGKSFTLLARDANGNFVPTEVTLNATFGRTLDAVSADPSLSLQDFIYGMSLFGINATPQTMEKLVTTLTRQDSAARNRLEYSQTPGYDNKLGIYAISKHIEARASTIAKTTTRQQLRELMNRDLPESRALWDGDEAGMLERKQAMDAALADPMASPDAKRDAQMRYAQAKYMYDQTNPKGEGERANTYYNRAASTLAFLDGNKFVDESDFGASATASSIRAGTSIMQLGGSLAQGVLNMLSIYTNWVPYMSTMNEKSGFGGGFNFGKVMVEYHRAFSKVGAPGALGKFDMNRADFYDGVAKDLVLQKRHGLTPDEARAIADEIREGNLIPAQSNALLATARGQITNRWMRKFVDVYMSPFNLSEQAVRRASFLATYRMFRDRAMAYGESPEAASKRAQEAAVKALDYTLGNYSVLNRPPAWRSGIQSFAYMYKTYPTTSIQLFRNLGRDGQMGMLGGLLILTGVTGLPFAEDIEDIVDTLGQAIGMQQGSVRANVIRYMEREFPGWSPWLMRGAANQFIDADVASRTSLGNLIPGTELGIAGSDSARTIAEIAGPVSGVLGGLGGVARALLSIPADPGKGVEDLFRNSPVTMMRAFGDAYAYTQSGAVVDRRGYVVSPDMDAGTLATRVLGFFPERASTEYDIIRLATREGDYQKAVVAAYRMRWLRARMRGDFEGAQQVVSDVMDWNRDAPDELRIRNFLQNSNRALQEARRSATERALRAAPAGGRQPIRELVEALTD